MPRKYGSYVAAWRRLQEAGVRDKIMESLIYEGYGSVAIDSTTVEAKRGWGGRL